MFADREMAGRILGEEMRSRFQDVQLVLGIARGGVVVAAGVAQALLAPLDVAVARKLGAPGQPELAIGAVAPGVRVVDVEPARTLGVTPRALDEQAAREESEIQRRTTRYRGNMPQLHIRGSNVVIVDDGLATGATAVAAARWVRSQGARRVTVAVPVASASAVKRLEEEVDEVVALEIPAGFRAVGEFYSSFEQISDEQVIAALAGST